MDTFFFLIPLFVMVLNPYFSLFVYQDALFKFQRRLIKCIVIYYGYDKIQRNAVKKLKKWKVYNSYK